MHNSAAIASGRIVAERVPAMRGVAINWVHETPEASIQAARQMARRYQIVHPPALVSRHASRGAIDMNIQGMEGRTIRDANGNNVNIRDIRDLNAVGATFGVRKLEGDPPHWSDNGH